VRAAGSRVCAPRLILLASPSAHNAQLLVCRFDSQPPPLRPAEPSHDPYDLEEAPPGDDLLGEAPGAVLPHPRGLPPRPTALRTAPSAAGGRHAEVLSFLDASQDAGPGGAGGEGGHDPYGLDGSSCASGGLGDTLGSGGLDGRGGGAGGLGGGGTGLGGRGGSLSRPLTAATLVRDSSDLPRLASPALESLMGPSRPGTAALGRRPAALQHEDSGRGDDPYGLDEGPSAGRGAALDPYGELADSPATAGPAQRRGSNRSPGLGPLLVDDAEEMGGSASGPALFTSFGDALHTRDGGNQDDDESFGLGLEQGGGAKAAGPAPPSPLASRVGGASLADPYGLEDGEELDGLGSLRAGEATLLSPGGAGGGMGPASALFNASIRSNASAAGRYNATRAKAAGSVSSTSSVGGLQAGGSGGVGDPYGLGGEASGGSGGLGLGLPQPSAAPRQLSTRTASARSGKDDGLEVDYGDLADDDF
jgi:hypothetical protein